MKSFLRLIASKTLAAVAVCALAGLSAQAAMAPENEGQVSARETALEMAGAFSNDGYKIRDGHWSGELKPHEAKIVLVNLYAGNQYYFSLGGSDKAKKVSVSVYDETGKPVAGEETFQDPDKIRAAAGVSPVASGPYYVSVEVVEGEAADFCLLYSYK